MNSKVCMKRLMVDRKRYAELDHDQLGIYCNFSDDNMMNVKAMLIGPTDTPYEGGFYFFDINFNNQYPMAPPKVDFCTLNSNVRFNPNLYKCGKVCLSILGTWSGPGWTSVMNLITVLIDLQSLMNDNPIQNEPGYEKRHWKTDEHSASYRTLVAYHNLTVAQFQMMDKTPPGFECFKEIMERRFLKNTEFYEKWRSFMMPIEGRQFVSRYAGMRTLIHANHWSDMIDNKLQELEFKYPKWMEDPGPEKKVDEPDKTTDLKDTPVINDTKTAKKKPVVRKCPIEPAKNHPEGFTKAGEDNKLWVVKGYDNGLKRWVRHKTNLLAV